MGIVRRPTAQTHFANFIDRLALIHLVLFRYLIYTHRNVSGRKSGVRSPHRRPSNNATNLCTSGAQRTSPFCLDPVQADFKEKRSPRQLLILFAVRDRRFVPHAHWRVNHPRMKGDRGLFVSVYYFISALFGRWEPRKYRSEGADRGTPARRAADHRRRKHAPGPTPAVLSAHVQLLARHTFQKLVKINAKQKASRARPDKAER